MKRAVWLVGLAVLASACTKKAQKKDEDEPARVEVVREVIAPPPPSESLSMALVVRHHSSLTVFSRLARAAGIEAELFDGEVTVFAPTDAAFARLPLPVMEALIAPQHREVLARVLKRHVVRGRHRRDALPEQRLVELGGEQVTIVQRADGSRYEGALVLRWDLLTLNGPLHLVDTALLDEALKQELLQDGRRREVNARGNERVLIGASLADAAHLD
jgi:uncharacterized surface protein with fasciclin (FAS1) repeats